MDWKAHITVQETTNPDWNNWKINIIHDLKDEQFDDWYWMGNLGPNGQPSSGIYGGDSGELSESLFADSNGLNWSGWLPADMDSSALELSLICHFEELEKTRYLQCSITGEGTFVLVEVNQSELSSLQFPKPFSTTGKYQDRQLKFDTTGYYVTALVGKGVLLRSEDNQWYFSDELVTKQPINKSLPFLTGGYLITPSLAIFRGSTFDDMLFEQKKLFLINIETWDILYACEVNDSMHDWQTTVANEHILSFRSGYDTQRVVQWSLPDAPHKDFDVSSIYGYTVSLPDNTVFLCSEEGVTPLHLDQESSLIRLHDDSRYWYPTKDASCFVRLKSLVVHEELSCCELQWIDLKNKLKETVLLPIAGFDAYFELIDDIHILLISTEVILVNLITKATVLYGEIETDVSKRSLVLNKNEVNLYLSGFKDLFCRSLQIG
ncbi:MAG: hypothetical protein QE487_06295 [Fluviicola sp.]|nr:hypothetical protein [Fluviicola sp.]